MSASPLADWVHDARERTFDLVSDLSDEQLFGTQLPIINPLIWEIGHVAWFQEKWVLRNLFGESPARPDVDRLYDSATIPHDIRWGLPLPSRKETLVYLRTVRDRVLERVERGLLEGRVEGAARDCLAYFVQLSVFHEDMHTEAFTYTRQTLSYAPPQFGNAHRSRVIEPEVNSSAADSSRSGLGDAEIPGGTFWLGATQRVKFVFDNEKWAHPIKLKPFRIARAPVTQEEFAEFVEAGGYRRPEFWCHEGWQWRESINALQPLYWQRESNGRWLRRQFDRWVPLQPHQPIIHVNWYEAEAYCRWAGRRLPSEAEWEFAATGLFSEITKSKPQFPWGDGLPTPQHANLDWQAMECVNVGALPAGDSPFGCRQMIGNLWEWTSNTFAPYPGFVADPYKEYSEPWFGTHKVLRGGCWVSRSRLLRNTWRNFYTAVRRDVWAGFRTCAIDS